MNINARFCLFGTVALGLGLAFAPGCGQLPEAAPARAAQAAQDAMRVTTARALRATVRRTTEQPGQVEAFESTPVHARLAGYVRTVAVDIGDRVKKGQLLAELDVPEIEAEVGQKRAEVEQAEADRAQADAAVGVARAVVENALAKTVEVAATARRTEADVVRWQAEANRIEQLTRESAVTESLRDETRSKLESARAAHEESGAKIHSAQAALAEARAGLEKARADVATAAARIKVATAEARRALAQFSYARIVAPFDGVITRRHVDTGHLTVPGGTAIPLFVVDRDDRVTVSVDVPESDASQVDPGDPVRVRLQALDGRVVQGKVTRISWALDQGTRTLRAEIDLENPSGVLRPGFYAYATIVEDERKDALTVPLPALVRDASATYCMAVVGGRVRRIQVRPGLSDGTRVQILEGLAEGDVVVAANADSLADGQPVQTSQSENSAKPTQKH
jgi:RND family efflux transporter MFP subunit